MGENLYDFVLRNGPLNLIQKAQMTSGGKKKKTDKMGLLPNWKYMCFKGHSQESERTTHWMGENFGKAYIRKGFVSTIYKELWQLYNEKANNSI